MTKNIRSSSVMRPVVVYKYWILLSILPGLFILPLVLVAIARLTGLLAWAPILSVVVAIVLGVATWILILRRLVKDRVSIETDRLVFERRDNVLFSDIKAFNSDDIFKIARARGASLLLGGRVTESHPTPFKQALFDALTLWQERTGDTIEQRFFYGTRRAKVIGGGLVLLCLLGFLISFIVGRFYLAVPASICMGIGVRMLSGGRPASAGPGPMWTGHSSVEMIDARARLWKSVDGVFGFRVDGQQDLICRGPGGEFILEFGSRDGDSVFLPTQANWSRSAPSWAHGLWPDMHRDLQAWCAKFEVGLVVDDGAQVY